MSGGEVDISELVKAIKHMHGLDATWIESVPVREMFQGRAAWYGDVQVFAVDHGDVTRVYAWSHVTTGTRRRFFAVLGAGPVTSPQMAVRASILAEAEKATN